MWVAVEKEAKRASVSIGVGNNVFGTLLMQIPTVRELTGEVIIAIRHKSDIAAWRCPVLNWLPYAAQYERRYFDCPVCYC
jgi:hypothetical protein